MNNKEKYLKFIKDFNNIGIRNILNTYKFDVKGFYKGFYSLENMQIVSNEMRKQLKILYPEINDNSFVLNTKEKNIEFIKDISNISPIIILRENKIDKGCFYSLKNKEEKYLLVVNEIKKQLDEVYLKYSKDSTKNT